MIPLTARGDRRDHGGTVTGTAAITDGPVDRRPPESTVADAS